MAKFMSEFCCIGLSMSFLLMSFRARLSDSPARYFYLMWSLVAAREAYVNYYSLWPLLLSVGLTLIAILAVAISCCLPDRLPQSLEG